MQRSKPDSDILLQAAIDYLRNELQPTLSGYHAFQTRVTVNVLEKVRRELVEGEAFDAAERARLAALLGHEGTLEELNRELAGKIRSGAIPLDDGVLRAHVRQSLVEALSVNNPKWLAR